MSSSPVSHMSDVLRPPGFVPIRPGIVSTHTPTPQNVPRPASLARNISQLSENTPPQFNANTLPLMTLSRGFPGATPIQLHPSPSLAEIVNGIRADGTPLPSSPFSPESRSSSPLPDEVDDAGKDDESRTETEPVLGRRPRPDDEPAPDDVAFIERHVAKQRFNNDDFARRHRNKLLEFASATTQQQNILLYSALLGTEESTSAAKVAAVGIKPALVIPGFPEVLKRIREWASERLYGHDIVAYKRGATKTFEEMLPLSDVGLPPDFFKSTKYKQMHDAVSHDITTVLGRERSAIKDFIAVSMSMGKTPKPAQTLKEAARAWAKFANENEQESHLNIRVAFLRYVHRLYEEHPHPRPDYWNFVDDALAAVRMQYATNNSILDQANLKEYFRNIMELDKKWYADTGAATATVVPA